MALEIHFRRRVCLYQSLSNVGRQYPSKFLVMASMWTRYELAAVVVVVVVVFASCWHPRNLRTCPLCWLRLSPQTMDPHDGVVALVVVGTVALHTRRLLLPLLQPWCWLLLRSLLRPAAAAPGAAASEDDDDGQRRRKKTSSD